VKITSKYPQRIQQLLQDKRMVEIHIGRSNSQVYKILNGASGMYLKTQAVSERFSFAHEVQVLRWLDKKLPVPEVIEYVIDSGREYLLLTEISGENCVEAMGILEHKEIVFLLAKGLRVMHSVDISACPFDERIDKKLKSAEYNVDNNLVNESDFDEERLGIMTSKEILSTLQNTRQPENNLVFAHGDYCLPNILIQDNKVNGFIDLDRAGVSDRYNDLAIASRSIQYNLGGDYEQLFFEYYGVEDVDKEKIAYYRLMDELF